LKTTIIHLYGEETASHIRLMEKLRIKKTKLLTSLTFLLRCRDQNIIPGFLQFHHYFHSRAANRIYQRNSFALLRERIHNNRHELDHTSLELLQVQLRLVSVLSESDWSPIDRLTSNKALTSAFNIQTPRKYPEENIPYLQHGENLKTTINRVFSIWVLLLLLRQAKQTRTRKYIGYTAM
jgi:hypothetical protein